MPFHHYQLPLYYQDPFTAVPQHQPATVGRAHYNAGPNTNTCVTSDCAMIFPTRAQLEKHAKDDNHLPFPCGCGDSFKRYDALNRHLASAPQGIPQGQREEARLCRPNGHALVRAGWTLSDWSGKGWKMEPATLLAAGTGLGHFGDDWRGFACSTIFSSYFHYSSRSFPSRSLFPTQAACFTAATSPNVSRAF
ncbi:hypothetical protein B0H63DRAFT_304260 [Podospora didyma]|uniref:C2H2-type domain-containing protein n=1 Tax=Podospora didyma TaxID=330526 RepID=A0AAE0K4N9_9PEZI|nr:hypothetical protein B0H63DRAFT_304260 [Podospora didyma]